MQDSASLLLAGRPASQLACPSLLIPTQYANLQWPLQPLCHPPPPLPPLPRSSVKTFAAAYKAQGLPLHVLALNAGSILRPYRK